MLGAYLSVTLAGSTDDSDRSTKLHPWDDTIPVAAKINVRRDDRFFLPRECLGHSIRTEVAIEKSNDVIPVFDWPKAKQIDMSSSLKQV